MLHSLTSYFLKLSANYICPSIYLTSFLQYLIVFEFLMGLLAVFLASFMLLLLSLGSSSASNITNMYCGEDNCYDVLGISRYVEGGRQSILRVGNRNYDC